MIIQRLAWLLGRIRSWRGLSPRMGEGEQPGYRCLCGGKRVSGPRGMIYGRRFATCLRCGGVSAVSHRNEGENAAIVELSTMTIINLEDKE